MFVGPQCLNFTLSHVYVDFTVKQTCQNYQSLKATDETRLGVVDCC